MELLRCLVVDDDEVGRELLILNLQGIARCDAAVNGREALEKYTADSEVFEIYGRSTATFLRAELGDLDDGLRVRKSEVLEV